MAVNFPGSPINGQQFTANGITYEWNSTLSLWEISLVTIPADVSELGDSQGLLSGGGSTGEGITAYTNTGDLPMTGVNTGAMAFVTSTNSLYVWNGSTWYSLSVVANTSPSLSGASPSYTLATDGTATVVTLTGTDTDGTPLTYSYSVTSGSLTNGGGATATVTQNGNVFTITPTTTDTYAGTFELTFTVSDGEASATASSSFTLRFAIPQQENTQGNTLLLTTSGSAGDNSAFTDSSSNALTITPAGTPSSQSFSPYRSGGYSLKLDGNDYITTGFNDNFGTGDFTFECWAKTTVGGVIMAQYDNGSQAEAFEIGTADGIIRSHTDSGTEGPQGSQDLRDNQWHYLVWERHSGTYYYYVDGSLQASITNSENGQQSSGWYIGRFGVANTGYFTGELRDLKFTVGTAVYGGSAPSVPTESTVSGSETFVFATGLPYGKDLSTNGSSRTITNYGDPIFVPQGPYDYAVYDSATHGGSVYFDGSSNMTIPDNSVFDFGTDPFTIEAWINIDTTRGGYDRIVAGGTQADGANNQWFIGFWPGAQINVGYYNGSGYTETQFNVVSMPNETWHHVAIVRDGANIECFFNGESKGTWNIGTSTAFNTGSAGLIVGARYNNGSPIEPYHGYISDLRIVKGTAVYTSDFTPPTEPLSSSGAAFHLVGTDANIYDSTQTVKPVTLVGNADSSTTRAKYTTSSIYMDGTGYVELPAGSVNISGSQDYTIEGWVNFNSIGGDQGIFQVNWPGNNLELIMAYWTGWSTYINGSLAQDTSVTPTTNQWYHIAVSRESGTVRVFLDGNIIRTVNSDTTAMENMGLVIGGYVSTSYLSDAYFEDWRVTTGLARYTEAFTPPTESLLTYTPPPAAAGSTTFENSSDGELTFTGDYEFTFSSSGAEAVSGASTTAGLENGKKYFEVELTGISDTAIGLYPVSVTDPGLTVAGGVSIDKTTGDIYPGPVDENLSITATSVLQFAYDATEQKVWLGVDGTWTTATGDPASGAGISTSGGRGETYALTFMSTSGLSSGSATGNIRTSGNLNYTVPTGFTAFADAVTATWYGDRQIVFMGYAPYSYDNGPGYVNTIEYFSFGDSSATDFGDATVATAGSAAFSDGSRAVRVAGYSTNVIDYISTATGGPATDFGNHLNNTSAGMQGISDGTYGVYAAGSNYYYVTIQNPSAWASNFGTAASSGFLGGSGGGGDGTYGIFTGGEDEKIEKITIATTGSATSHGDLVGPATYACMMSDDTYTVMGRGNSNTDPYLEYITTATGGTATAWANLYYGNQFAGASSDGTYGYVHGGSNSPSKIQYITFASPSNQAVSMGDLGQTVNQHTGTSGSSS